MAEWQDIASAPWNEDVLIRTEAGRELIAILGYYACDEHGNDCAAWAESLEGDAPNCWSEGICWEVNADGVRSDTPVSWQPLP